MGEAAFWLDLDKIDLSKLVVFEMMLLDKVVDALHRIDLCFVSYREPHFALPVLDLEIVARKLSDPAVRKGAGHENLAELMQLGYQTGAVIGSVKFTARQFLETVKGKPQCSLDGFGRDWINYRLELIIFVVMDVDRPLPLPR